MVGVFGAEMDMSFRSSGVRLNARIFGQFRAAHALFLGTIKNSPDLHVGQKMSMRICLNWMAWVVWKNDMLMHAKLMC